MVQSSVQAGLILKGIRDPQQEMLCHLSFLEGAGSIQLSGECSRAQHPRSGQMLLVIYCILIFKGAHQCRLCKTVQDAEQVLVIERKLVIHRVKKNDQHYGPPIFAHRRSVHRHLGDQLAIDPQSLLLDSAKHRQILLCLD